MGKCRYAVRSEVAYRIEADGGELRVAGPMLCSWGQDAAPAQLVNVPRWMQRDALAGHRLSFPDDCDGCPCYSAGLKS